MKKITDFFTKFSTNYFPKLKNSFGLASSGKEELNIVLWLWGGISYVVAFFANAIILSINIDLIQLILAIIIISYFIWHIIVIKRCSPKKIRLTKEEKIQLKNDRYKRWVRKLLLKESFTKSNPALVGMVIDLYIIVCFAGYF
ncbi:MAG: hypothetical protein ACJAZX_000670 [Rickettsiales bacterium]|jgi:hypothetical protein